MNSKLLRDLHRWFGLFFAVLLGFYCLTGILLNHRKDFGYFQEETVTSSRVPVTDPARLRALLDGYKAQIDREDDPAVIRIKDDTIEFLYGSHGATTYVIDPGKGVMEKVEKRQLQPISRLNDLHKAVKTSALWLAVADMAGLGIVFLAVSGLLLYRYRPLDRWLLSGGLAFAVAAMFLA
ncbi:PepSY-associated TM helix domain-containing protein [Thiovibrio sp. JS02]